MSKIEWTERSDWNPIRGCTRISEGCRNCYAEAIASRFSDPGQPFYGFAERTPNGPRWTGRIEIIEDRLMLPLKWRKPAKIFVNSASDLFHESIPDAIIDRIFAVMALCPQHTFQILTKRPKQMREYMTRELQGPWAGRVFRDGQPETDVGFRMRKVVCDMLCKVPAAALNRACSFMDERDGGEGDGFFRRWPLPNVWLGTTAENQEAADARIPDLLATPATVRFVSIEPMLGPIELCGYIRKSADWKWFPVECRHGYDMCPLCDGDPKDNGLDQVISGGESGPHARPSHPDWFRSLRDQCAAADVAYFHKQNGEWLHESQLGWWPYGDEAIERCRSEGDFFRVGKRRAGRLLDGVEHSKFPGSLK